VSKISIVAAIPPTVHDTAARARGHYVASSPAAWMASIVANISSVAAISPPFATRAGQGVDATAHDYNRSGAETKDRMPAGWSRTRPGVVIRSDDASVRTGL
jgi:hypothetical protein